MCAPCTEASWRASNSDWVTMSPFTLATTRSMISARVDAEWTRPARTRRRAALRRTCSRDGFIVHLGSGQEALNELAHTDVGLAAEDLRARGVPALRKAGRLGGEALVHPQHVISERARHDVTRLARGQAEGRLFELRGQLPALEDSHLSARARLGAVRAGLGQHGEFLRVLLEAAHDVTGFVGRGEQDLAEADPLR